jgi:hypothetical protein
MDLLQMFSVLHAGQLELFHLNFDDVILLPKVMRQKGFNITPLKCKFQDFHESGHH